MAGFTGCGTTACRNACRGSWRFRICAAANIVHQYGAREIHIAATHGVLCGKAVERLMAAPVESIVITDTIPLNVDGKTCTKIRQLSVAFLFAETIRRISDGESVTSLFAEQNANF